MASHEKTLPYGQCKCCLKTSYVKNMWEPQLEESGQWEVYGQMLVDCFGIDWTTMSLEEDNICHVCIAKLKVATSFKQLIIQSQSSAQEKDVVAVEEVMSTERVQVETIPSLDGKEVEVNFVPTSPRQDTIKTTFILGKPPLRAEEKNSNTKRNKKNTKNTENNLLPLKNDDKVMISPFKPKKNAEQIFDTPLINQNTTTSEDENSFTPIIKEHKIFLNKAEVTPVNNVKMVNIEKTTGDLATENTTRAVIKENTITIPENRSMTEENTDEIEMLTPVNTITCDTEDEVKKELKSDDYYNGVFEEMKHSEENKDNRQNNSVEIFEDIEYLEENEINDGEENDSVKNEKNVEEKNSEKYEKNDEENVSEEYEKNDEENESEEYEKYDEENESEEYEKSDEENESEEYEINDADPDDGDDEDFKPKPKKRKPNNDSSTKGSSNTTIIKRSKNKIYTRDDLKQALEAVKTGKMSRRMASRVFNVPRLKITEEDIQNLPEDIFTIQLLRATRAILAHTNATPFKVSGRGSFRCFFCGVRGPVFRHPDKLRQHTHGSHPDKVKDAEAAIRPKYLNQMVRFDIHELECDCSMQVSWGNMLDHLKETHGITDIEEAWETIVPYNLITETDIIPCAFPSCSYKACFSKMDSHMNEHFANYLCGECGKSCVSEWRLRSHTKQFHSYGQFPCYHCPKVFFSISSRNAHVQSVHRTRFRCKICTRKFETNTDKNIHLKKEHADRLESAGKYCNLCGNYFWPDDFDRHLKLEHDFESNSSVKKFKCAICSEMFVNKEVVLTHIKEKHQK